MNTMREKNATAKEEKKKMNLWIGQELEHKWRRKKGKNWITDLKEAGYRIFWHTSCQLERQDKRFLCITDCEEEMKTVKGMGYPCICVETGGYRIYGADLVVEKAELIHLEVCESVYNRYYQIPSVILETQRLIVRETVPEDANDLYEIYEDGNGCYLDPLPESMEEEQKILSFYFQNIYGFYGYGMWSVVEKESGAVIGRAGVENGEIEEKGILELGYVIGRAWQGKGYGFEAAEAVLRYAKEKMGEEEVYLKIDRDNLPSIRLAEKLGFEKMKEGEICWFQKKL